MTLRVLWNQLLKHIRRKLGEVNLFIQWGLTHSKSSPLISTHSCVSSDLPLLVCITWAAPEQVALPEVSQQGFDKWRAIHIDYNRFPQNKRAGSNKATIKLYPVYWLSTWVETETDKHKKAHDHLVSDSELVAPHCIIQCPRSFSKPQARL